VTDHGKSLSNQVGEITKLVNDVQDKLDQVLRALGTLQARVAEDAADIDEARVTTGGPQLG
jgi:peptidoglycan hydrolase CwlO-like protein